MIEEISILPGVITAVYVVDCYKIMVTNHLASVFDTRCNDAPVGDVWIDDSGAWSASYEKGYGYMPINEILPLLGYKEVGAK